MIDHMKRVFLVKKVKLELASSGIKGFQVTFKIGLIVGVPTIFTILAELPL